MLFWCMFFPLTKLYQHHPFSADSWRVGQAGDYPLHRLSDIAAAGRFALHAACWRRLWRCCLAISSLRSRSAWISFDAPPVRPSA